MSTLAALFADLAALAMELEPAKIRSTIVLTVDDGLRAARFDGAGGRSAERSSHPERTALNRLTMNDSRENQRPSSEAHDLKLLDESVAAYVEAVYELATRSHTGPFPNDWRSAVLGHRRLIRDAAITVLENLPGIRPARYVHKAGDALHDIDVIRARHCPRIPTPTDRLLSGDPICLSHARIGDYDRTRHGDLMVCKTCRDLIAQIASPSEVHKDADWWPSIELLREHADMERTGKRADYQRARSDWIDSYPSRRAG